MTYYDTSDTTAIDPRSDEPRAAEAAAATDPGKPVRGLTYCLVLWQGRFSAGISSVSAEHLTARFRVTHWHTLQARQEGQMLPRP